MTDNQLAFKPSYKETVLYHRKINNQWLETVINNLPTDITRPGSCQAMELVII